MNLQGIGPPRYGAPNSNANRIRLSLRLGLRSAFSADFCLHASRRKDLSMRVIPRKFLLPRRLSRDFGNYVLDNRPEGAST
jgi:hypothetical protein